MTETVSGFHVDVSRGQQISTISAQWASRPDDQRYLSLSSLYADLLARAERSRSEMVSTSALTVEPGGAANSVALAWNGAQTEPTHWAFGQLAGLAGAPASWLRRLPAGLAALNLQFGLKSRRAEQVQAYVTGAGPTELRALTGPFYGRIPDHALVAAVMRFAGDGTGDTCWKVPGVLDWSAMVHNPHVKVSKETTTLYASDRDVFLFLVDDTRPIEAGRLADGSPDLFFRGFYCWNSEVGAARLGIATFYLRAVCQNRTLWGVEQFRELSLRHSRKALDRFAQMVEPALVRFTQSSAERFREGVQAARGCVLAHNDEDRARFLRSLGLSAAQASRTLAQAAFEEGRQPETAYDFVQAITAAARSEPHQDQRIELERLAGRLLARTA